MTGASGGVGVHALQVARILGARVVAVTSSEAEGGGGYARSAPTTSSWPAMRNGTRR